MYVEDVRSKIPSEPGVIEQSSSSVIVTTASAASARRKPAFSVSPCPRVPAVKVVAEVDGVTAFSPASSCCSKPQPDVPAAARQPKSAASWSGVEPSPGAYARKLG